MELGKALQRILRTWWIGFIIAGVIYGIVFWWAYNYEVHREEEGMELEEPLELFDLITSPSRITTGTNTYIINITNDQVYTIRELTVEFRNIEPRAPDDFSMIYSETLNPGSDISYPNFVQGGASSLVITLDGQELITGLTDINLYVQKEGSSWEWSSTDPGNNEEVRITRSELENAGYGNYVAIVRHESGVRDVDFELTYRITYEQPVLLKSTSKEIKPEQSYEFEFILNLDQSDISQIECVITGTVELPSIQLLEIVVILDPNWNIISFTSPIPEEIVTDIPWGPVDLTGTSSAILYTLTVIVGFAFFIRSKLKKILMPTVIRRAHCFISLLTLMFVFAHMSTAMQKDWPWESTGMRFAVIATILLVSFNVFSFFDVEIIKSIGKRKWRLIHLAFTIAMALSIVIHFGLMGDHLGFLK